MDISQLFLRQTSIYEDMRRQEREESHVTGIVKDPGLIMRRGGFFLSMIHPPEFARKAAAFSAKIGALTQAMVYDEKQVHTTVGSIPTSVAQHFYFDINREDHAHQLSIIECAAEEVAKRVGAETCEISFITPCILLPNLIIAPGEANQAVFEVTNMLATFGTQVGVPIAPCKNGHMTLSRFTEAKGVEEITDLRRLIKTESVLGVSRPIGIAAGYTLRHESERSVADLRETPGHFHAVKLFPFQ